MKQCRKLYLYTTIKGYAAFINRFCEEEGIIFQELMNVESFKLPVDASLLIDVDLLYEIDFVEGVTVVMKKESVVPYLEKEYNFIFDVKSSNELYRASYIKEYTVLSSKEAFLETEYYKDGTHLFDWARDMFLYRGEKVYLTPSEKRYLYKRLMTQENVNSLRCVKYRISKKLGKDFFRGL